ncbi:PJA2 ligase, partial [Heliornis fulica]|nr:PJA2 ligase [Heliornis fulica]
SSPLGQASSHLLHEPLLENTETDEPVCQDVPRQTVEGNVSPVPLLSYGLEGKEVTGNFMNTYQNSDNVAELASGGCNDLNGQNGIAFVNIDAYEPDSSDGEEDNDQVSFWAKEGGVDQEALDDIFCVFNKGGIEAFTDLQDQLLTLNHRISRECCEEASPDSLMRYVSIDPDLACPENSPYRFSAEDQAIWGSNPCGAKYETQQINDVVDAGIGIAAGLANELHFNYGNSDEGNSPELVVRRKIRNLNSADDVEDKKLHLSEEKESFWRRIEIARFEQDCADCPLRSEEEMCSSMSLDSRQCEGHQKKTEDEKENARVREQDNVGDSLCDEDSVEIHILLLCLNCSSDWSDGEWLTVVPNCFNAAEKDHSLSDKTGGSIPDREETDPKEQSSSGVEVSAVFYFHGREEVPVEEGEIPWVRYRENLESSSDEENDSVSDVSYSGFLLLDGNNNLDDEFDLNEDLDMEWRLLDELDDALEFVHSVSSMDPHFLPFLAVDGPLQHSEPALEILGLDSDHAHPPATKETIDNLPESIFTGDEGEEHCCTICCSEFVEDEMIMELPCQHLFHKTCVTIWLQKSGTCPVCRHVLEPVIPEPAAAHLSFLLDDSSS